MQLLLVEARVLRIHPWLELLLVAHGPSLPTPLHVVLTVHILLGELLGLAVPKSLRVPLHLVPVSRLEALTLIGKILFLLL